MGVEQRVSRRLLELADIYASEPPSRQGIVIPLTQSHLADLAGATRPTVNQVLQLLAAEGVIAVGRSRVEVLDADALRRRALS
jgi:CRP-like cAMP-binding protein